MLGSGEAIRGDLQGCPSVENVFMSFVSLLKGLFCCSQTSLQTIVTYCLTAMNSFLESLNDHTLQYFSRKHSSSIVWQNLFWKHWGSALCVEFEGSNFVKENGLIWHWKLGYFFWLQQMLNIIMYDCCIHCWQYTGVSPQSYLERIAHWYLLIILWHHFFSKISFSIFRKKWSHIIMKLLLIVHILETAGWKQINLQCLWRSFTILRLIFLPHQLHLLTALW